MTGLINRRVGVFAMVLLTVAGILGPLDCAWGDQTDWRVGLAAVRITPEGPIRMSGYAGRTQPSTGVLADLHAKAMAIEDAEGGRALLITADLIGFPASLAEAICKQITEETGLTRRQILFNPSHTHTGPVTRILDTGSFSISEDQRERVKTYLEKLQTQLVELAATALADVQPARFGWGTGRAEFVMNRRESTDRGVILGVNPDGYRDKSVPVLRVDSPEGRLRAVVFGCACHNTTLTGKELRISGDYAGFAQEYIEGQHAGVQAMFVIGCAGDANPYPRSTPELARQHGQTLGAEVCRILEGQLEPVGGPLGTELEWADLPLAPTPSRERLEEMAAGPRYLAHNATRMLDVLDNGKTLRKQFAAPVAVWQFGDDLTVVALSGEVVSDYVRLIQAALGPERLWIAAYSNDVFGYLPSKKVLAEGGYETRGLFHEIGFFAPEAEDALVVKVRQLARKAGRTMSQ